MRCSTASVKSASRNAGSRSARAFTVSLKSRVNAIGLSSFSFGFRPRAFVASTIFALLVVGPSLLRGRDVVLLAALRASRQQNHQTVSVPAEIDPVARPEVDPVFVDPR